jgi:NAD kinase
VSLEKALEDYKNIKPFKENIGNNLNFTETAHKDEFDMVITIGGDGTILWAHKLLNREDLPPFVCFDGGSLCFLSNF